MQPFFCRNNRLAGRSVFVCGSWETQECLSSLISHLSSALFLTSQPWKAQNTGWAQLTKTRNKHLVSQVNTETGRDRYQVGDTSTYLYQHTDMTLNSEQYFIDTVQYLLFKM